MMREARYSTAKQKSRSRWVLVVVGLAAVVAAGFVWPSLWRSATPGESSSAVSDLPEAGMDWFDKSEREPAPDVAGSTLDGEQLALADLRGEVVVVNVWGSWCVPCRDEAPDLARLSRETRADGVRFLGIDTRDNKAAARAFVRKYGIEYPSLYDPDGSLMVEFNGVIPVNAVPSTIVLDPDGRVAARVVGKVTYATLRGLVVDVRSEASGDGSPSSNGARG